MKTLDEVIEAERHCIGIGCRGCPYDIVTYGGSCECNEDVLHYLEKYRENFEARNDQVERYQKAAQQCEEILTDYVALKQYWAEQQENEPLTWDELKQMEGKPVWVESHGDITQHTGWAIVKDIRPDRVNFILSRYEDDGFYAFEIGVLKKSMGAEWQAYRKERHETGD